MDVRIFSPKLIVLGWGYVNAWFYPMLLVTQIISNVLFQINEVLKHFVFLCWLFILLHQNCRVSGKGSESREIWAFDGSVTAVPKEIKMLKYNLVIVEVPRRGGWIPGAQIVCVRFRGCVPPTVE